MSNRIPKTAAVVATAATAAFAAYAVGSQTNSSGTAGADAGAGQGYGPPPGMGYGRRDGDHFGPGRAAFLSSLASRLGVTPEALRSALQALRPQGGPGMRGELAQALADALKVDRAKVVAALQKLRAGAPMRGPHDGRFDRGAFAAALAKELGVKPADVTAAFQKLRAQHQAREQQLRDAFAQKLAVKLGISVDKVKSALAAGPFGGPGMHGPRHGFRHM